MKKPVKFNLVEAQQRDKEMESWAIVKPCMVCGKTMKGYYGRWGDGGTCDHHCEAVQAAKPRYPPEGENYVKRE